MSLDMDNYGDDPYSASGEAIECSDNTSITSESFDDVSVETFDDLGSDFDNNELEILELPSETSDEVSDDFELMELSDEAYMVATEEIADDLEMTELPMEDTLESPEESDTDLEMMELPLEDALESSEGIDSDLEMMELPPEDALESSEGIDSDLEMAELPPEDALESPEESDTDLDMLELPPEDALESSEGIDSDLEMLGPPPEDALESLEESDTDLDVIELPTEDALESQEESYTDLEMMELPTEDALESLEGSNIDLEMVELSPEDALESLEERDTDIDLTELPEEDTIEEQREYTDDSTGLDTDQDGLWEGNFESSSGQMQLVPTINATPELIESMERDNEIILDNYASNLRNHGVAEDKISDYINQAREQLMAENLALLNGEEPEQIFQQPTDWGALAVSLGGSENIENEMEIGEEGLDGELNEIDPEDILRGTTDEYIEEGIKGIQIDSDPERLDNSLEYFRDESWEMLDLNGQKNAIQNLGEYIEEIIGFENKPQIEYYKGPDGEYGGFSERTNTLRINENMLYNAEEAADTIAHELWHAHQYECASNPKCMRDRQYGFNFENYIEPKYGQVAYESQLVEAEARAFARRFKERIKTIGGM